MKPQNFYNERAMVDRYLGGRSQRDVFEDTASSTFSDVQSILSQPGSVKPTVKNLQTTRTKTLKSTPLKQILKSETLEQPQTKLEKMMTKIEHVLPQQRVQPDLNTLSSQPNLNFTHTAPPPRIRHPPPVRRKQRKSRNGLRTIIISQTVVQTVNGDDSRTTSKSVYVV